MLARDNALHSTAGAASGKRGEVTAGALLEALAPHHEKELLFVYDGREVQRGYHVTEVKAGQFASLDCGARPEAWRETVIQLWDIPAEPGQRSMTVAKFRAIVAKVSAQVALDPDARLTFEVSDGTRPLQLYAAFEFDAGADAVRVALAPRAASCKPRDRWLEDASASTASGSQCCGAANKSRCG